jgi:hypothetical protein
MRRFMVLLAAAVVLCGLSAFVNAKPVLAYDTCQPITSRPVVTPPEGEAPLDVTVQGKVTFQHPYDQPIVFFMDWGDGSAWTPLTKEPCVFPEEPDSPLIAVNAASSHTYETPAPDYHAIWNEIPYQAVIRQCWEWFPGDRSDCWATNGMDVYVRPPGPPKPPSDLLVDTISVDTGKPAAENSMELVWKDNSFNEDSFEVRYKNNKTNKWTTDDLPDNSESWAHEGVTNGVRYSYQARACNTAGCSPWSNVVGATARPQWDDISNFTKLDYGIYWFKCGKCRDGKQNPAEKTSDGIKANTTDVGTSYYDPNKPTFIYIHGIQTTGREKRESFVSPMDNSTDMAAAWLEKDYNVGIFYWNQIADDDGEFFNFLGGLPPYIVESKVWKYNPKYWRWRTKGGGFSYQGLPANKTVADLFVGSYKKALKNHKKGAIRLAGHSLGNQVAARGTLLLDNQVASGALPLRLRPTRVALLDPYYSVNVNQYLGYRPRDKVAQFLPRLKSRGILFEYYHTSIQFIHPAMGIADQMAYVRVFPDYSYLALLNLAEVGRIQHMAGVHWYLLSISYSPPAYSFELPTGFVPAGTTPSAAMPPDVLGQASFCSTGCYFWEQVHGKESPEINDDGFERKSR